MTSIKIHFNTTFHQVSLMEGGVEVDDGAYTP